MLKKIFRYVWSVRFEFSKYFIIGISGLVLDMGLLKLFIMLFHTSPTFSLVMTQIILLIYNFTLNKYWSFKNNSMPHTQFVRYLILACSNYAFGIGIMFLFNEHFGLNPFLVRLATIALMVSWNFLLYKYWVYKS